MIAKNAMQFKAIVKKKAFELNVHPQLLLQTYMLERLLERISLSKYKNNFIVKGGFLISSLIGVESRTTWDLDYTLKNYELNAESILIIFKEILAIHLEDNVSFKLLKVEPIREIDMYCGLRVFLHSFYDVVCIPITVDITVGDAITPHEISHRYKLLFDEGYINFLSYNIETILAEKLEAIFSRAEASTRPKDYYDVYMITKIYGKEIDLDVLNAAIEKTFSQRNNIDLKQNYEEILNRIIKSEQLKSFWSKFIKQLNLNYDIDFLEVVNAIQNLIDRILTQ